MGVIETVNNAIDKFLQFIRDLIQSIENVIDKFPGLMNSIFNFVDAILDIIGHLINFINDNKNMIEFGLLIAPLIPMFMLLLWFVESY